MPRDGAFAKSIRDISRLYTRKLKRHKMVLCVDEKTSLQPRTRKAPTLPAQPKLPVRVEHEYQLSLEILGFRLSGIAFLLPNYLLENKERNP